MFALRFVAPILALGVAAALYSSAPLAAVSHAASSTVSTTVFGQGAELHLSPLQSGRVAEHASNVARVGDQVRAVGLGFHPGDRVRIIFGMPDATNYIMNPIARATVDATGRFDTRFTVTRAMDRGGPYGWPRRYAGPIQPLMFEAFEGTSPGVGQRHAYAVSYLVVYAR